jgi:hypothetical protein
MCTMGADENTSVDEQSLSLREVIDTRVTREPSTESSRAGHAAGKFNAELGSIVWIVLSP